VLLVGSAALGPTAEWKFVVDVAAAPVMDAAGISMPQAFLGGFDVPRPQLVDIHGDGHLVLFVQERPNDIMYFERVDGHWLLREEKYQGLDVGEWFRFVDIDGDGRIDLLGEMPTGYIRMWRNVGTRSVPKFVAVGDTIRDTDGLPILADRQNILNAVDIDCNGKLDLFIGRVQGTVDRYEQDAVGPDGTPRFRMLAQNWEGIEILGPEARMGTPGGGGPLLPPGGSSRHGANTLTFADIAGKGTLDLFWGDFFEPGLLRIENSGSCQQPNLENKPVQFPPDGPVLTSGYNAPTFGDLAGDGNLDLIMGVIGGAYGPSRTSIDNLYLLMQTAKGKWETTSKRLIPTIDVGSDAMPALGDLHGNGKLDLLIGNRLAPDNDATGTITWFENVGTKTAPAFRDRGTLPIRGEFSYAPTVVDLDGDGLPDLVVGTWRDRIEWYRNIGTRLYRNTGTRTAPKFLLVSASFQDIRPGRRSTPALIDMDGDGKPDLLIGSETGDVQLWRNTGTGPGVFQFAQDSTFRLTSYSNAAPAVGDLHGTGHLDILVGTAAGGVRWFENKSVKP
jgi:uncharacterized protein (DUF2141 family)